MRDVTDHILCHLVKVHLYWWPWSRTQMPLFHINLLTVEKYIYCTFKYIFFVSELLVSPCICVSLHRECFHRVNLSIIYFANSLTWSDFFSRWFWIVYEVHPSCDAKERHFTFCDSLSKQHTCLWILKVITEVCTAERVQLLSNMCANSSSVFRSLLGCCSKVSQWEEFSLNCLLGFS